MELIVTPTGDVRCVYDELMDVSALGAVHIRRASHVEPDARGQWLVDLSPVGGPLLGPCERRSCALAAEHDWLSRYWLL